MSLFKNKFEKAEDYYFGRNGKKQNYEKALKLYIEVEPNNSLAGYRIGVMYANGYGVQEDRKTAAKYFERNGDWASSHLYIGQFYLFGWADYPQDTNKAIEHIKKSTGMEKNASHLLGKIYADKKYGINDLATAAEWMEKAAAQGHEDAKKWLNENAAAIKKAKQDKQVQSAKNRERENNEAYDKANSFIKQNDYKSAIPLFAKVAQTDSDARIRGSAALQIARIYFLGGGGVFFDNEKAAEWATKAKENALKVNDKETVKAADDILMECD